jgi:hypothetical protein
MVRILKKKKPEQEMYACNEILIVNVISQTNPTFLDRINGAFETERIPVKGLKKIQVGCN